MIQNKKLKRNATYAIAEVAEVALCASNCALPTSNDSIVCVNCRLRNHVTCSTQIDQFPDLVARFKCNACYSIEGYLGSTRHCSSATSNISNTAHDNASIKSLIDNEYQDVLFNECKYFTTYSLNNALRYRLGDVLIVHFNI